MNATITKCCRLTTLLSCRSKYLFQPISMERANIFLHPTCFHLDVRCFHKRQRSGEGWVWPVPRNTKSSLANFSSQKDGGSSTTSKSQKKDSTSDGQLPDLTFDEEMKKLGLFAKFKKMYKEYWYVLLPAHIVTSTVWFGSFYYLSTSGVDIVSLLEQWNFHELVIKPFRDSSLGHVAVAYLLYKAATPARYAVTLGTTTLSIKYLVRWGFIKPVPTRAELMQMYQDKKEDIQIRVEDLQEKIADRKAEIKDNIQEKKQLLIDKKQSLIDDYNQFKEEFKTGFKSPDSTSDPSGKSDDTDPKASSKSSQTTTAHEEKRKQG